MKKLQLILTVLIFAGFAARATFAQTNDQPREMVFNKIELLEPNGDDTRETAVRLRLSDDAVILESAKDNRIIKEFKRTDIKAAEYSYSKNPRWKTGLGLGAASVLFLPLLFVAIPVGFTKHRRHWLTIRGANDFAVLKLSKSARKIVVPAFETRTGVKVEAVGDDK